MFDITEQIRDFDADDVDIAIRFSTGRYEHARTDRLFDMSWLRSAARNFANDLAQGRLVRPFDTGVSVPQEYAYHLVYPEGSSQDPRVLAFRDWILSEAG